MKSDRSARTPLTMVAMSTIANALVDPASAVAFGPASPAVIERRRERRYAITLLGRFMRENKQEFPCKLHDISVAGAAIMSPADPEIGERIVGYFDHIGGIEGVVARVFEGGFAIDLRATAHKREKLAQQLAWLTTRGSNHGATQRRHDRFAVPSKTATLQLEEGIAVAVRVIDVSISGAAVETEARPAIGTEVILGKLRARVVRHHAQGLGLEFTDIQNPDAVRRYFG